MIIILTPLVLKLGKNDAVATSETSKSKDIKRKNHLIYWQCRDVGEPMSLRKSDTSKTKRKSLKFFHYNRSKRKHKKVLECRRTPESTPYTR